MCTYLDQVGSTYYFRRVVPAELRPFLRTLTGAPRAEWKVSLRTKDREAAKRLIPALAQKTNAEIDVARAKLAGADRAPQSPTEPLSPLAERIEQAMFERGQEAAQIAFEEDQQEADDLEALEAILRDSSAPLAPELRRAITRQEAELGLEKERVRRYRGRYYTPAEAENPAPRGAAPEPAPVSEGVMLDTAIVDRWAAERKVAAKTKDAHAAVARWFYERARRAPVDQISRRDVLTFKDKLIEEGQSTTNTNTKLARLATLLQWAVDNELAAENVARGVSVKDTDKAANRRQPFDLPALTRIFESPVFAAGARPTQGKGEAAYWLPVLALYTGARLEELGQLRPTDVQEIKYADASGAPQTAWFVRITSDDDDALKLKNAGSERDVPIHPELVRLGFLDYVSAAQEAEQARLFPALRANKYGRLTAKWGEWFSTYLRGVCKVTDRRLVFHSFRHAFKQYARLAAIPEGVQRQIMGHSAGDVADQYGSGYPLHQVVEGMKRYAVPGLKL